jgi:spore coat polysaccharide biosynthesis protein SpsF
MIVRITSDCPCIDYDILDELIKLHLDNDNDYTSNSLIRTYPHGLDAEVMKFSVLEEAYNNAKDIHEIEHVTPYIYDSHKYKFKIGVLKNEDNVDSQNIRITLDTKEDYMLLCAVFDYFKENQNFKLNEIIKLFNYKPWLYYINNNIIQKKKHESAISEIGEAIIILEKQELYRASKVLKNNLGNNDD